MNLSDRVHMPSLDGATEWFNSDPLGPSQLRGRVVLVDFWTLTCINWLRTAPYIRAWSEAYRTDGLVVIGVHSAEFSMERDLDRVRTAIRDRGIHYPVVVDNDFAIWNAFTNHYWPALYFVDREGIIRDEYFGENKYEESERIIQELLGIERDPVAAVVVGAGIEAPADWQHLRSAETYLGFERSDGFASPGGAHRGQSHHYEPPEQLLLNQWALSGSWKIEPENVVLESGGGSVVIRFAARDAHLVLSHVSKEPIAFRVTMDGGAPGASHGTDVDEAGNGLLNSGRLYQLIRQNGAVRERTLEISFLEPGPEAYVATFG
jgi:thiol-disulfide isomerase/thioredoxin